MSKRNELQQLQGRCDVQFKELFDELLAELSLYSFTTDDIKEVRKIIGECMSSMEFEKKMRDIIGMLSLEAAQKGLGSKFIVARTDQYINWRMHEKVGGVSLSKRVRESVRDVERKVTNTIKSRLKLGTNWQRLRKEIQNVDKVADVSTKITDIVGIGKEVLMNKTDVKELEKAARQAERYVEDLAKNSAPTGYLKRAYQKVIDAVESKDPFNMQKALQNAMDAKVRYNAERISRTELGRAYNDTFQYQIENDEDVIGYKWLLSSRHPVDDICNFYSELDNGSGPGVYSKGDFPSIPAHVNCLCTMVPVAKGPIPNKVTQKSAMEYINKLPRHKRAAIVGVGNSKTKSGTIQAVKERVFKQSKEQTPQIPSGIIEKVKEK